MCLIASMMTVEVLMTASTGHLNTYKKNSVKIFFTGFFMSKSISFYYYFMGHCFSVKVS